MYSVFISVCIMRFVLNGVNYVGLMMFDSNHFCATHLLLLSTICMDSLLFGLYLTIGRRLATWMVIDGCFCAIFQ